MDTSRVNTQTKKRKTKWSYEAEELLLVLWAQNVTKLCRNRKKFYIFAKMSNKMEEIYPFTAFEISVKIHNLKSRYKEELKRVVDGFTSQWPMYDSVHRIMETFDSIKVEEDGEHSNNTSAQYNTTKEQHQVLEDELNEPIGDNGHFESFLNENSFDNVDVSMTASSRTEYKKKSKTQNRKDLKYLKSINENLILLVEKINDLSKQSQAMERQRNASIKQLIKVLKMSDEDERIRQRKFSMERPLKKIKRSNSVDSNQNDDDYDNVCNYIQEDDPLCNESNNKTDLGNSYNNKCSSIDKIHDTSSTGNIKNGLLKMKQMENDNTTEKLKMQMKYLKMEKDIKK